MSYPTRIKNNIVFCPFTISKYIYREREKRERERERSV